MRKKKIIAVVAAATLALSMVGCGSGGSGGSGGSSSSGVANKDKPLCWFNRQPSNSSTGELDKEALSFNKDTYYVGFDANQGAELQGQMVLDYIKANAATIDRNGDGVIGYVLAIGDIGHNDSIARTRGVRSALGNTGYYKMPVIFRPIIAVSICQIRICIFIINRIKTIPALSALFQTICHKMIQCRIFITSKCSF